MPKVSKAITTKDAEKPPFSYTVDGYDDWNITAEHIITIDIKNRQGSVFVLSHKYKRVAECFDAQFKLQRFFY